MSELLEVRDLKKYFVTEKHLDPARNKVLHAVDGVSLRLHEGQTLGLVGESGCGKSTLGRCILRLHPVDSGEIIFQGSHLEGLGEKALLPYRRQLQMIFQDPYSALNPRMSVLQSVIAPLDSFDIGEKKERAERAEALLRYVGLSGGQIKKYPHELSGGQRQRVVIARSIICRPSLVVCDEPVSALDASIRAQVLNLMRAIQREQGISYLFISHDLSVVRFLCDRVAVMYLGQIVEEADRTELYSHPAHPYTQALLSAIPEPTVRRRRERIILSGELPSPLDPPSGCRFCTRCRYATERCRTEAPVLRETGSGHSVACHLCE